MKQFLIIACGGEWADSCLGAPRTVFVCSDRLRKVFVPRVKGIKVWGEPPLQWAVSGVGLPRGKARLFRWKMVLRLVSPAWARGRPACRTAWFMRVVISAVATWINHVARIKLLLNDAQHFPQVPHPPSGNHSRESCAVAVVLQRFSRGCLLMAQYSSWRPPGLKSSLRISPNHWWFPRFYQRCQLKVGWLDVR